MKFQDLGQHNLLGKKNPSLIMSLLSYILYISYFCM